MQGWHPVLEYPFEYQMCCFASTSLQMLLGKWQMMVQICEPLSCMSETQMKFLALLSGPPLAVAALVEWTSKINHSLSMQFKSKFCLKKKTKQGTWIFHITATGFEFQLHQYKALMSQNWIEFPGFRLSHCQ